jgi:hypothetical protein
VWGLKDGQELLRTALSRDLQPHVAAVAGAPLMVAARLSAILFAVVAPKVG